MSGTSGRAKSGSEQEEHGRVCEAALKSLKAVQEREARRLFVTFCMPVAVLGCAADPPLSPTTIAIILVSIITEFRLNIRLTDALRRS
ncbi:unnamed protein product [Vitrella brassicaformis CCMP3155]|uniref:Uncharacterized protein n=1 Tax=Vitrella brassicaformis (strain CCMP3155) TaxID=1169540 RepID=A0A0G4EME2_VITBC|nr:unnamed protein product [Vitrella brassicaformis CCMP3155]|eukprot:CEL98165.1 unnamed protein product [Vitrella brassicaformis CCMP3155]